jgi:hypothetical protein
VPNFVFVKTLKFVIMKTRKTTLFTALAFALFMSLGTATYAGMNCPIDDPIVDPDLLDRPRVALQPVSNRPSEEVAAKVLQQGDQITLVFEQRAGIVIVEVQATGGEIIYYGAINTDTAPTVSFSVEEDTNLKLKTHNK